jgi:hypothetical membrane protein
MGQQRKMNKSTIFTWAGIIGPALFVLVFLIEGALRPGYNALSTYVSALSLGPRGWIQITNFLVFGTLLFLFSRRVAAEYRSGAAAKAGPVLLTITALCYFFSGPFVMDPQNTPLNQITVHGTIHGILGALAFTLMPISMIVYQRRFRTEPAFQRLRGWTLLLTILCSVAWVVFSTVSKAAQLQSTFSPWFGVFQRALIIPFMLWVFLFGRGLLRRTGRGLS